MLLVIGCLLAVVAALVIFAAIYRARLLATPVLHLSSAQWEELRDVTLETGEYRYLWDTYIDVLSHRRPAYTTVRDVLIEFNQRGYDRHIL